MPKQAAIIEAVLESRRPLYGNHAKVKPLSIKGNFIFISDFEIPFHHAKFLNGVFEVARLYGIRQCVWGGDAMHFEAFSPFHGADSDAEQELSEIDEYLPGFLEPFSAIFWFMGNHDDRPQRALDRKISNEKALRLAVSPETMQEFRKKVELSEYYWCYAGRKWQLEHPKNNSMIPSRVAQALTAKYHCNVITAHTHKAGMVRVNGYWAVDSGCAVDTRRLAYPNLRHSTHTTMQNGAVLMIEHGGDYVPILLTPENLDFKLWQAKKQH